MKQFIPVSIAMFSWLAQGEMVREDRSYWTSTSSSASTEFNRYYNNNYKKIGKTIKTAVNAAPACVKGHLFSAAPALMSAFNSEGKADATIKLMFFFQHVSQASCRARDKGFHCSGSSVTGKRYHFKSKKFSAQEVGVLQNEWSSINDVVKRSVASAGGLESVFFQVLKNPEMLGTLAASVCESQNLNAQLPSPYAPAAEPVPSTPSNPWSGLIPPSAPTPSTQ